MEKLDFIDSKFRLAILAAKRAKQLVGGSKKKLDSDAENPLTVALEEIYDGQINFHILEKEIIDSEDEGINFNVNDADSSFGLDDDNPLGLLYNQDEDEGEESEDEEAEDDKEESEDQEDIQEKDS